MHAPFGGFAHVDGFERPHHILVADALSVRGVYTVVPASANRVIKAGHGVLKVSSICFKALRVSGLRYRRGDHQRSRMSRLQHQRREMREEAGDGERGDQHT